MYAMHTGKVCIGLFFGLIPGSPAVFYGGFPDYLAMHANDILYSIPNIMSVVTKERKPIRG